LRDRYAEFADRGAEVLAVAADTPDNARDFFQSHQLPFPCLPDPGRDVYKLYGVESNVFSLGQRPGLFVIDAEGIVQFAYVGRQQWEIPSIDATLREVDALA
jgi:peroxiredoxin Q/BCP